MMGGAAPTDASRAAARELWLGAKAKGERRNTKVREDARRFTKGQRPRQNELMGAALGSCRLASP